MKPNDTPPREKTLNGFHETGELNGDWKQRHRRPRLSLQDPGDILKFLTATCEGASKTGLNMSINISVPSRSVQCLSNGTNESTGERVTNIQNGIRATNGDIRMPKKRHQHASKPARRKSDVAMIYNHGTRKEAEDAKSRSVEHLLKHSLFWKNDLRNESGERSMYATHSLQDSLKSNSQYRQNTSESNVGHHRSSRMQNSAENKVENARSKCEFRSVGRAWEMSANNTGDSGLLDMSYVQQGQRKIKSSKENVSVYSGDIRVSTHQSSNNITNAMPVRNKMKKYTVGNGLTTSQSSTVLMSIQRAHPRESGPKAFDVTTSIARSFCRGHKNEMNENTDMSIRPRCQSESRARCRPQSKRRQSLQTCLFSASQSSRSTAAENDLLVKAFSSADSVKRVKGATSIPRMKLRINLPREDFEESVSPLSPMVECSPSPMNDERKEDNEDLGRHFDFDDKSVFLHQNGDTGTEIKTNTDNATEHHNESKPSNGSLTVKIQYLIITKRLKVTVVRANGLQIKEPKSTYARACLMPRKQEKQSTKIVKKSRNPEYDSVMYFHNLTLPEVRDKLVRVKIMAKKSKFRFASPVGEIRVKLDKLDILSENVMEKELEPYCCEDEPKIEWYNSELGFSDYNWD